jgi:signal transduction histidine kinase
VEAVGSVARLALANERLAAQVRAQLEEVRASRTRIVEAADAERRRVERDLHDGAQQRLTALAVRLDVARETGNLDPELLAAATEELRSAIGEVRDLSRGLHPTILTEAGLGPAIEALAERTTIPVRVTATTARFPASIEAAAYFVAAEGLTNVARYAGATTAAVDVSVAGATLVVTVTDDGRGGADPETGSGLRGLSDRVAALGGHLAVMSPPGAGTTLRAELPLAARRPSGPDAGRPGDPSRTIRGRGDQPLAPDGPLQA